MKRRGERQGGLEEFGQQTPRRWGWGTPLKKRTATRTALTYYNYVSFVNWLFTPNFVKSLGLRRCEAGTSVQFLPMGLRDRPHAWVSPRAPLGKAQQSTDGIRRGGVPLLRSFRSSPWARHYNHGAPLELGEAGAQRRKSGGTCKVLSIAMHARDARVLRLPSRGGSGYDASS